jgi:hypothetical protein
MMKKDKYRNLLLEYYTANNSFIEKGIFTISAGAITFLLNYSGEIQHLKSYKCAFWGFIVTLILQIIAARLSKEGCNKSLDRNHPEKGNLFFTLSEKCNDTFLVIFVLSILSIVHALL